MGQTDSHSLLALGLALGPLRLALTLTAFALALDLALDLAFAEALARPFAAATFERGPRVMDDSLLSSTVWEP